MRRTGGLLRRLRKKALKRLYPMDSAENIAQGWDRYARRYVGDPGEHLGDEWSLPELVGHAVPREKLVSFLDQEVFSPFLGTCGTLLEIGAGGGRFTEILLPKCRRLIASDTSPTMLKLLRKRFPHDTKIEYLLLDGKGLSGVDARSVDAAFSWGVFVHLQHWDIYNYIQELKRVLRPGGKAIIQHPNTFSELGWKHFLAEVPASVNRPKLPTSFSLFTPEIMKEFVERAGLTLKACLTDVVQRDGISLIVSEETPYGRV
jgi:SAM-dependent methyltransferase